MSDSIHRFLFEDDPVRGETLQLCEAYREILSIHHYPPAVARLLGEFLVAAGLLGATLKFDGHLTLQARSDGEVPLIMAEVSSKRELRAIARGAEEAISEEIGKLLAGGQLAITIQPTGGQRYQGIVELGDKGLAAAIEHYFNQSEQLATRVWLAADGSTAGGLFLQELPEANKDPQRWEHLIALAETITAEELLSLSAQTLLHRLYHQENLRLFKPKYLKFHCSCSEERVADALITLGQAEVESILTEHGQLESQCEFCARTYRFSPEQALALFEGTDTLH